MTMKKINIKQMKFFKLHSSYNSMHFFMTLDFCEHGIQVYSLKELHFIINVV